MDLALLHVVNCKSDIKIKLTGLYVITWLSYFIYSDI